MTPEVSAEDFKSLESKVDRLTDELEDQRRSSESEMSRVIRETNEALAAQRAEAKAAAEKDVLKATLVTGGTAAAAATATAIILDQVIDEDDDDHVGEIVTGLGSAGLIGAGAACEPGSTGRQVAFALGFGGLAGLAYHLYRRSQKPKPEPGRIGVDVDFLKDALDVIKVDEDSPAARAGIEVGDKIMSVDGHKASHGAKKVAKRLVGPVGGKVQIEVRRPRTWQLLKLTLVREAL